MFSKLYTKIKKYIIENHNFILFLILLTLVLNIKLPYIVERPGGIINLKNQIKVDGKSIEGNFNSSYVSVNKGTVISVVMGLIMPNWDIVKLNEYTYDDIDYDENFKLEKLSMNESHSIALMVVFDKLSIPYTLKNEKLYVYYKDKDLKNDLEYNDQIIKCDETDISGYDDLSNCIYNSTDNNVDLVVIRNGKKVSFNQKLHDQGDRKVIGIGIYRDNVVSSEYKVEFNNSSSESGPSGGFMDALALYDYFSKSNLSKGLKVAGTGTIDLDGYVGEISGIKYKLLGAEKKNVDVFFVPKANYKEAVKIKKKHKLKINIVKVETLDDAINYLEKLKKSN